MIQNGGIQHYGEKVQKYRYNLLVRNGHYLSIELLPDDGYYNGLHSIYLSPKWYSYYL